MNRLYAALHIDDTSVPVDVHNLHDGSYAIHIGETPGRVTLFGAADVLRAALQAALIELDAAEAGAT